MNTMHVVPPGAPADTEQLSPLKRAFLALEDARARLARAEEVAREPVAVIGIGCRVPGGDDPEGFWRVLHEGRDAAGPVPRGRFDIDAYYDPDTEVPGRIAVREAGFLSGEVDGFDPAFFGIAPREANGMDPQQRLLLEVSWEALEHAGIAPDRLERSATGVYVGVCATDYAYLQIKSGDAGLLDSHYTSGVAQSVASGRISYLLGLQGPSLTIDTACSSSLVAVHLACQALRARECSMALAGGVNLMLSADLFIAFSHSRMLAPDGRCKTFDASADGFARGEGCGVVVLKRLSDAQADGDRILAVIRGSAVNQDGPSSGLTAPNGPAQESVIREALERARLTPADIGMIEAHGTGTQLGDPLEVQALGNVFGPGRDPAKPIWLGSVKTNLGHLEAAAGVSGLIKVVLALQHHEIPAHLHFKQPSPHIAWAELPFRVPTKAQEWEPIGGRRVAGVSSFGFSGTNVHVVVEEAPRSTESVATKPGDSLYTLSARDEKALRHLAARHAAALARPDAPLLADACFTANVGRAQFAHRATIAAASLLELRNSLDALSRGEDVVGVRTAVIRRRDPPRIAFVFTGQGSQYSGMARALYDSAPAFRAALDRCASALEGKLEPPLLEVLYPGEGVVTPLDRTEYTQPALFAVEYALAELWKSYGVTPSVVMGHSVGELVAACVAGMMSLEDALGLVAARGRLMGLLPAGGAMAAIFVSPAEIEPIVAAAESTLAIAAVNAPDQTVVSGTVDAVEAACKQFEGRGIRCQRLTVSHAFHSPLLDPMLDEFERAAAKVAWSAPRLRVVSNLTGDVANPAAMMQPAYWRRHAREAVRFAEGVRALVRLRADVCIEIGPHPALLPFIESTLGNDSPVRIPTLRRNRADRAQMLDAVASAWLEGVEVDWFAVHAGEKARRVALPTYPFQRERCWFTARTHPAAVPGRATGHPLLGTRIRSVAGKVYECTMAIDVPRFVAQHCVQGQVLMPATGWLEMLLAASRDVFGASMNSVTDVTIQEAMLLEATGMRTVQLTVDRAGGGMANARVYSLAENADWDGGWTCHVTATLGVVASKPPATLDSLAEARMLCTQVIERDAFYEELARRGLNFGPAFRSVRDLWCGRQQALGCIDLVEELRRESPVYNIHPVLLDGCVQVVAAALVSETEDLYLPMAIGGYTLHHKGGERCWAHAVVEPGTGEVTRRAQLRVFDEGGELLAELSDIRLKRVSRDALDRLGERWLDESLYEVLWQDAASGVTAGEAVPVSQMASVAQSAIEPLRESVGLPAFDACLPGMNALCADFIRKAFEDLGWAPKAGTSFEEEVVASELRVVVRHRQLFGRFLLLLAQAGWLEKEDGRWVVKRDLAGADPARVLAAMGAKSLPISNELEMVGRAGPDLAKALRGECDPLQLLFPGGETDTAERIYRDSPPARFFNGLVAEAVSAAVARAKHAGRTLRILEVGAGTGGTTAHVAPRLPDQGVEYTFTDVGPLFVARARQRFGKLPFMRFEILDLEREPETQGFADGAFDLIVASNVIHATRNLRTTLGRVRRLLAPGGALALLEATVPQAWFDLTVGLTEGWWCFEDRALRPDYAMLPTASWVNLLGACGFGGMETIAGDAAQAGAIGLNTLLIAQAADAPHAAAREWLIFADAKDFASGIARRLAARGDHCTLVRPGARYALEGDAAAIAPASAEDHVRLLSELRAAGREPVGVVHAWSLDLPEWKDVGLAELASARELGAVSAMLAAQALVGAGLQSRLWIVTAGAQQADPVDATLNPAQAPVWGLRKALSLEHPEMRAVCVDLDANATEGALDAFAAELCEPGSEAQVALRRGMRRVARLVRVPRATAEADASPFRLVPADAGSLDAFRRQNLVRRAPGPGEVEIAIEASGLNFKDVLNVLGMYPGDPGPLGGECAGRVTAVGPGVVRLRVGDAVMGLGGGCLATHVTTRVEFVQPRPEGMGAEEGAAFPIAFLTALFCLDYLAKLRPGERVLVHAGAGGVGMAAVQIALCAGAVVYATAGSEAKRELLREMGVAHVFDSRSAAFGGQIAAATGGRGVDVVLNSLAGDTIEASFSVLAQDGRFVEMGKRGIKTPDWVDQQKRGWRYFVVDWGDVAAREPDLIDRLFTSLTERLRTGKLVSLPRHAFALDDAPRAFRFMAQALHTGKIVLRHGASEPFVARRDGTYLVTGGLSGLGPVVAKWLVERGAGRIALVSRRGVVPESAQLLDTLRALGSNVVAEAVDVSDEAALRAFLVQLRTSGPPLRGVFHSAGVLDDATLAQQDPGRYARVFAPKVDGGCLLDRLTRADPLDAFVLFSSVASLLGSAGQSNHSAANAFLDLLARERRSRGLAGLAVNWGAWSEVGAAVDRAATERIAQQGLSSITPAQGIAALERLLGQDRAQVAVLPIDWQRYLARVERGAPPAFFTAVAGLEQAAPKVAAGIQLASDLRSRIKSAPGARRRQMLAAFVRERALRALGVDPGRAVDPRTPLGELGLDSLLAVELRNTLGTAVGSTLPATLLFDYPTIDTLTDYLLNDVLGLGEVAAASATAREPDRVASIEDLSDEEVEKQLAARLGKRR
jgi:acyl transferase domain-containing protein